MSPIDPCNPIVQDLQTIVNVLSGAVGVVVVAMIIWGGIQYAMAGDNPQTVTAAKNHITNAVLALLAFMFMFAFLQWLVPGGVFGGQACTTNQNSPQQPSDRRGGI